MRSSSTGATAPWTASASRASASSSTSSWTSGKRAARDRLEDAVDYRDVAACVREVSDGRAYHLLEALATALADELLARFPVERVSVRVRKPDVVLDPPVEYAAVSATRP